MKRIVTLLLAAGLVLGAYTAQAAEIKVSGWSAFAFEWGNQSFSKSRHSNGNDLNDGGTSSQFHQRFRAQIDIIASEALSGVVGFEIGEVTWGKSRTNNTGKNSGGAFATDGTSVEIKHLYVDWLIPQTDARVRMGLQPGSTPSLTGLGSMVMDDDVAGITISNKFNQNIAATAWWSRPFFDNADGGQGSAGRSSSSKKLHSNMDMFGLALPLTFDGVKVTPWGMWATVGRDSLANDGSDFNATDVSARADGANAASRGMLPAWMSSTNMRNSDDDRGNAYWLGLSADIVNFDPFRLAFDMNYGSYDGGTVRDAGGTRDGWDIKTRGWVMNVLAEYKLDFMTPGLIFWYGSGDDSSAKDGSEMMPAIDPGFKATTFGFSGQPMNSGYYMAVSDSASGTWGLALRLADISFVKDLKHTARFAYYRGTNSKDMIAANGGPITAPRVLGLNKMYMTKEDDAWEINLDSTYDIYKNLQLGVELGYIRYNIDSTWGSAVKDDFEKNAYKVSVGMKYSF